MCEPVTQVPLGYLRLPLSPCVGLLALGSAKRASVCQPELPVT